MSEKPTDYIIPANYNDGKRFKNIPYRNIIEAIVAIRLIGKPLMSLPISTNAKIVIVVLTCGLLGLLFIVGIKDESVTQFMYAYIVFLKNRRKLHLRRIGYVPKKAREEYRRSEETRKKQEAKEQSKRKKEVRGITKEEE